MLERTTNFLIAEFHEGVSQWQHINDRMDKEVQYYFTLSGVVGTIIGLILQFGSDVIIALPIINVLIIVIGVAGFRLLRRIIHLTTQAALFSAQIGLIRSYFKNLDTQFENCSILTAASKDKSAHDFTPISKQLSVRILFLTNSLAAIITILVIPMYFYVCLSEVYPLRFWITVFAIVGIISIVVGIIFYRYQRQYSIKGDSYLEDITRSVQVKFGKMIKGETPDNNVVCKQG